MSEEPGVTPVFLPHLDHETLEAVERAFADGWLGMGATTRAFEEAVERWLGVPDDRRAVATNTGTAAIHLAVVLAGVGPGDEVIVPSFDFVADHQAIVAEGGVPVFCDIREDDLGLDPDRVEALISERTKAILPLHFAGVPCRIEDLRAIAAARGLRVIEDATHAFGTKVGDTNIGATGDLACFSFDPVKVITAIDGGMLILPVEEAERARHLRLLGIDRDTEERYRNRRAWDYDVVSRGFRYHMTNINAAVGLSQLRHVDRFIERRRAACRRYTERLAPLEAVQTPATDFEGISPFIYTILVPARHRNALIEHLRSRNIAAGIHFLPAHRYAYFRNAPRGDLSVTERVAQEILTLPLHSDMDLELVDRIAEVVQSFFEEIAPSA